LSSASSWVFSRLKSRACSMHWFNLTKEIRSLLKHDKKKSSKNIQHYSCQPVISIQGKIMNRQCWMIKFPEASETATPLFRQSKSRNLMGESKQLSTEKLPWQSTYLKTILIKDFHHIIFTIFQVRIFKFQGTSSCTKTKLHLSLTKRCFHFSYQQILQSCNWK